MAHQTEVELLRDGSKAFKFTDGTDVAVFAQERVWHVPLMPSNGIIGLSPLQYGARTMGIAISAEDRSEEHTSELQSLMRISYAVFCLKKKNKNTQYHSD